jgi:DNA polymerase-3 subunit epsilon
VTEVAVVVVRDGRVHDAFETLINPERSIPPYISRLTNITHDMVRHQPVFADVAPRLVPLLDGSVFVGHNAKFDHRWVRTESAWAGVEVPSGRVLCTVRLARRLLPHLRRRSLDHIAHHYGVRITNRHRAMGDALATARCFLRLLDDAGARGLDTWEDLDTLVTARTGAARRRRQARALPVSGEWEMGA